MLMLHTIDFVYFIFCRDTWHDLKRTLNFSASFTLEIKLIDGSKLQRKVRNYNQTITRKMDCIFHATLCNDYPWYY